MRSWGCSRCRCVDVLRAANGEGAGCLLVRPKLAARAGAGLAGLKARDYSSAWYDARRHLDCHGWDEQKTHLITRVAGFGRCLVHCLARLVQTENTHHY